MSAVLGFGGMTVNGGKGLMKFFMYLEKVLVAVMAVIKAFL